eukprot:1990279-Pyramimonas_sp.AAC.1
MTVLLPSRLWRLKQVPIHQRRWAHRPVNKTSKSYPRSRVSNRRKGSKPKGGRHQASPHQKTR